MVATRDGVPLRMIGVVADVTERHVMEDVKLRLLEQSDTCPLAAEASPRAAGAAGRDQRGAGLDPRAPGGLREPRQPSWCPGSPTGASSMPSARTAGCSETAVVHIDPRRVRAGATRCAPPAHHAGGDGIWSVRRAMRSRPLERVEDITADDLAGRVGRRRPPARCTCRWRHARRWSPRSCCAVASSAASPWSRRGPAPTTPTTRTLLENLASRAATAIDTAVLFDSRTAVARALQQTLLPAGPARDPRASTSWADYRVAEAGIEIGGDFYDVFEYDRRAGTSSSATCAARARRRPPPSRACSATPCGPWRPGRRTREGRPPSSAPPTTPSSTRSTTPASSPPCWSALHPGRGRGHRRGGVRRPPPAACCCGPTARVERVEATGTLLGVLPSPPLQEVELDLGPGDSLGALHRRRHRGPQRRPSSSARAG